MIHMGTISCFMVIGAYSTGCIFIATSAVMTKFIAFVTSLDIKSIMYPDGGGVNEKPIIIGAYGVSNLRADPCYNLEIFVVIVWRFYE